MGARRDQVLDAAIQLVVEEGTYGLTHRKIDARIPAPMGTTSNYFPNRLTLARAIMAEIIKSEPEYLAAVDGYDESLMGEELLRAWLRRRTALVLGPWQKYALAWYRFIIDGAADPDVRAAVAEVRHKVFSDTEAILARCGSTDVARHARMARSYVGGVLLTQHLFYLDTSDLDRLLDPMVRGLMHVIKRDAEVGIGTP